MVTTKGHQCRFACLTGYSAAFVIACIVFWTSSYYTNEPLDDWLQELDPGDNYTDLVSSGNVSITWRPFYSLGDRLLMPRQPVPGLAGAFKPRCRLDAPCISVGSHWFEDYKSWEYFARNFYPQKCPYQCSFVSDVSQADAVLFNGRDLPAKLPKWKRHAKQMWVYINLESPRATSALGLNVAASPAYHTLFNWTSTYQRDSIARTTYGFIEPRPVPVAPRLPNLRLKKRLAYIVLSNCHRTFNNRAAVVRRLQAFMDVDVYGRCGKRKLPRSDNVFKQLGKKYYFYLSFENAFCKDYITEKFFGNALSTDAAPVAIGGLSRKDYEAAGPPNSFVYGPDYRTAKELAEYLRRLAADTKAYMALFAWRATHQVKGDSLMCGTCRALYTTMPDMLNSNGSKKIVWHLSSYYSVEKYCRPKDFTYLI